MNTIIINGTRFEVKGKSISVVNGKVTVGGESVTTITVGQEIKVSFEGDLASLDCHNAEIHGDVYGDVDAHNINCKNIRGDVDAHNVTKM